MTVAASAVHLHLSDKLISNKSTSGSSMAQFAINTAKANSYQKASLPAIGSQEYALRCRHCVGHSVLPCLLLVVVFTGCGEGTPQAYNLQGTVSYNGKEVPTGSIIFLSNELKRNTAEIGSDGSFQTELPAGEYQIGVFAPRKSSKEGIDAFDEAPLPPHVPAYFGQPEKSGLSVTIEEHNENTLDLTLTGELKKRRRRRR